MSSPKSIFIAHPSILLTDHLTHGDALTAFNFVSRLALRGHRLNVVAEHVALRDPLPDGVRLHRIRPRRPRSITDQVRCAYRIRRVFEGVRSTEGVDLVHQLNPVDLGLSCLLPAARPPVVLGPYVPDWPAVVRLGEGAGPIQHAAYRAAVLAKTAIRRREQRRASTILLSTPAAETKLALTGSSRPRIRYVSPGVDAGRFTPPPSGSPDRSGEPTILFLANLNVRKGILTLLDAFDAVAERLPTCRLRIGGEGQATEQVRQAVQDSRHGDRIEVLGRVEPDAVPDLMQVSDVFCLPSFAEPFGISVLEAMACGRPVVATGIGGLAYLVRPEGGRTVPPGDPAALAAALVEVLKSPELRAAMGRFNRSLVERQYAWERVIDQLEAAYDETVTR